MMIIPYLRREYETDLSKEDIFKRLEKMISNPDWNVSVQKAINNRVLEGKIENNSFTLVMGKYALTYGRSSLLPIMKGRVEYDHKKSRTIVKIVIRPFLTGVFLLTPVYCLLIYLLIRSVSNKDMGSVLFSLSFLGILYGSLITKYNKEKKNYIELIEKEVLA